jgi:hypothetical protein
LTRFNAVHRSSRNLAVILLSEKSCQLGLQTEFNCTPESYYDLFKVFLEGPSCHFTHLVNLFAKLLQERTYESFMEGGLIGTKGCSDLGILLGQRRVLAWNREKELNELFERGHPLFPHP